MVTKNKLEHDLRERLDDLTSDEVSSILESSIKKFYGAYLVYDIPLMERYGKELKETKDILKSKFNNIVSYSLGRELFYESSISQFKERYHIQNTFRNEIIAYINLYRNLENDLFYLKNVLSIYYWNHSNYSYLVDLFGDLSLKHNLPITFPIADSITFSHKYEMKNTLMDGLDNLIGDIRDNILETMDMIERKHYNPNFSHEDLEDSYSMIRNHIHELIEDDYYRYVLELGLVNVEKTFIPLYKLEYELNEEYSRLKKEIDDLFEGDNGFNHIIIFIEESLGRYPENNLEDLLKDHPQYNIMKTRFIPKENDLCENIYGDHAFIMKSPHQICRWDYYYHDFSHLEEGDSE